ncbi:MAG: TonB family protein [Bacteroidota bacterium]|nr:TonB family protein [Bacteroidota bacterium]
MIERIPPNDTTVVNLKNFKQPEIIQPKPQKPLEPQKAADPIKTIADPPPVVKPDNQAQKPVTQEELQTSAIGPKTLSGKEGEGGNEDVPEVGPGNEIPKEDITVYNTGNLDAMPEPIGGMNAWAKFLNKNLRFPAEAQEDHISGKVFLSFIIEKDGHLSNITVIRVAGHGFDEEALRVLKLAKAWKPGTQNGQPVRVKYSIPINFQLTEE